MVILFVALGGVIAGLGRMSSSSDDLGYNTMGLLDGAYNTPGSTTSVSHPVSGVALPVSSASRTLFHHTAVPSYNAMATPALSGGSYAAQGLTLTSQGAMNAFGGGGSASSAGTMHTSSQSASYAMGGGSVGGSYRTGRSGGYAASTFSAGSPVNSTFSPAVYAAAPAAPSAINNDFSTWGKTFNTPFVSASEHQTAIGSSWLVSYAANRRSNSVSIEDTYYKWLQSNAWDFGAGADNLTEAQIRALWEALCANNEDFALTYTYEEFFNWFLSKQGDETFKWKLPVGDGVSFLLFLCVAYIVAIRCRQQKREQV